MSKSGFKGMTGVVRKRCLVGAMVKSFSVVEEKTDKLAYVLIKVQYVLAIIQIVN